MVQAAFNHGLVNNLKIKEYHPFYAKLKTDITFNTTDI